MKKIINIACLSLATLVFNTSEAFATQWVEMDGFNLSRTVFVDVDSIVGEGSYRIFWSKTIHRNDQQLASSFKYYRSSLSFFYVNCEENKIGTIEVVFYDSGGDVVDSFKLSQNEAIRLAQRIVPDSLGDSVSTYVCALRTATSSPSLQNNPAPVITRQNALLLINEWLVSKKNIFAPPYSRIVADRLTTGEFRQELFSSTGPIQWLIDNNAWYQYGDQRVGDIRMFATSKTGKAIIEVSISEDVLYYQDSSIVASESGRKTTNVRYHLERVGNQWKIARAIIMP